MATLQDLNERVQKINKELSDFRKTVDAAKKATKGHKKELTNLEKRNGELDTLISSLEVLIPTQVDPVKTQLENDKATYENEKAQVEARLTQIKNALATKEEAEEKIEKALVEMDGIIAEFAADPRINTHLQEAINIKYDDKIEEAKNEKTQQEELNRRFSVDLQDDKVFGTLVEDLRNKYTKLQGLPKFAIDAASKQNADAVRAEFTTSLTNLQNAIANNSNYQKMVLSVEDFEAIIAGPDANGEIKVPTLEAEVKGKETVAAELEAKKTKILEKIKSALVVGKMNPADVQKIQDEIDAQDTIIKEAENKIQAADDEIKKIDDLISQLSAGNGAGVNTQAEEAALKTAEDELNEVDEKIKNNNLETLKRTNEIRDIDNEIAAENYDQAAQTTHEDLKKKTDMPADLLKSKTTAEKYYEAQIQDALKEGYITEETVDLEACKTQYEAFKAADLAVRKAFLEVQTDPTDNSKDALKQAMEDYKKASADLVAVKPGLTVENWHDYLVNELNEEAKEGSIDEAYYSDTMKSRLDNISAEFKSEFKENPQTLKGKMRIVYDAADEIAKKQEEFLKGNNVEYTDVENDLNTYENAMAGVFKQLKDFGVTTLASVQDLFGKLKGQIVKSGIGGIFARIKGFFTKGDKKEIPGTKSKDEEEQKEQYIDAVKSAKKALEEAENDIEEHLESKLTKDEIKKLKELDDKESKINELNSKKNKLTTEKDDLVTKKADLDKERTAASDNVKQKEQELNDAKAKAAPTGQNKAQIEALNKQKSTHEKTKSDADTERSQALAEKSRLMTQKMQANQTQTISVENSDRIAHGDGKKIQREALKRFEKEDDGLSL